MADKILLRRGNKADLPTLTGGEPGFALDTKELYIGTASGNEKLWGATINPASLMLNGYQRLASGVVIQWGTVVVGPTTSLSITFPLAFNVSIPPQVVASTLSSTPMFIADSVTNTLFVVTNPVASSQRIKWIAIGWI